MTSMLDGYAPMPEDELETIEETREEIESGDEIGYYVPGVGIVEPGEDPQKELEESGGDEAGGGTRSSSISVGDSNGMGPFGIVLVLAAIAAGAAVLGGN